MEKKDILERIISIKSVLSYIDIKCCQLKKSRDNIKNSLKEFNESYQNNIDDLNEKISAELDKVTNCEKTIMKLENSLKHLNEEKNAFEKSKMDYKCIKDDEYKKELKDLIIREIEKNILECNNTLEKEKEKLKKYNDNVIEVKNLENKCKTSLEELNIKMNKIFTYKKKQNQIEQEKINLVFEKLCTQNIDFIHYKDFDKLDYIYFYIETGRANTIMDALNLVDLQLRHEELITVLKQAVATICLAIKTTGDRITDAIADLNYNLCEELQSGFSTIDKSLDSLNSELNSMNVNLDTINKNQKEVINVQKLTNSLIEDQNKTCEEMLKNYRYVNGLSGDL